jgi:hypothetical protein
MFSYYLKLALQNLRRHVWVTVWARALRGEHFTGRSSARRTVSRIELVNS